MSDYENLSGGNQDVGCNQTHMTKLSVAVPNFVNAPKYLLAAHRLIIQGEFLTSPIYKHCFDRQPCHFSNPSAYKQDRFSARQTVTRDQSGFESQAVFQPKLCPLIKVFCLLRNGPQFVCVKVVSRDGKLVSVSATQVTVSGVRY
jgi:hypothetical protein